MPLIRKLESIVHQIWYTEDAHATDGLAQLRVWWDALVQRGPGYGYFDNAQKTILLVKSHKFNEASAVFQDTGIQLEEGSRDLGAAVGTESFVQHYVATKVSKLYQAMEALAKIAETSPHAAHAAFVHGMRNKWLFIQRTLPNTSLAFEPLEQIIKEKFFPALPGDQLVSDAERALLSLPGKFGGFAIDNPVETADMSYKASRHLCESLVGQLIAQDSDKA
jgi:hypothetical protein